MTNTDFLPQCLLASALVCSSMVLRADPPQEGKWERIPELTDEFQDGRLDSNKWHDHNPEWQGRQPGYFSKENVTVKDGKLHLTARLEDLKNLPEGYHTFTTAAVKSKTPVRYGYFEIKCRPMKSKASSAFWFYNNTKEEWAELDVFEVCGVGAQWTQTHNMNAIVFHSRTEKKHQDRHQERTSDPCKSFGN